MSEIPTKRTAQEMEVLALLYANSMDKEGDQVDDDESLSSSSSSSTSSASSSSSLSDKNSDKGYRRGHGRRRRRQVTRLEGGEVRRDKAQNKGELPSHDRDAFGDDVSEQTSDHDCHNNCNDDASVASRNQDDDTDDRYGPSSTSVEVELRTSSKSVMTTSSKSVASKDHPMSTKSLTSQSSSSSSSSTASSTTAAAVIAVEVEASLSASTKVDPSAVTIDDYNRLQEKLAKCLHEEEMLLSLQQQLLVQLEGLEQSIVKSESEERIARLALKQAQVQRLLADVQNGQPPSEEEPITIHVPL